MSNKSGKKTSKTLGFLVPAPGVGYAFCFTEGEVPYRQDTAHGALLAPGRTDFRVLASGGPDASFLQLPAASSFVVPGSASDVDTSDDEDFSGVPLVAISFNITKGQDGR